MSKLMLSPRRQMMPLFVGISVADLEIVQVCLKALAFRKAVQIMPDHRANSEM